MDGKGFHVVIDGEYGDSDNEIRLMDGDDEIVMWSSDEWKEEPSLVAVIVNAVRIGYTEGPNAIRERLAR